MTPESTEERGSAQLLGRWNGMVKILIVAFQLGVLVQIFREFQLESRTFLYLLILTFFGFLVHSSLPLRLRLPFFLALSLGGIGLVLGLTSAIWLIGLGLILIGICHLPISFLARVLTLLVVGASLIALRVGVLPVPWSSAIWPLLGSMFMFRLIIYMYDQRHGEVQPTFSSTLAYFFMLPNVSFPFFPVIDYRTFRRTYYDGDPYKIYQTGIAWMFRGAIHLILYRLVYYHLALAPQDVQSSSELVRFLITNYLLYLRVSGLFHLVVGMMHLFGFNLPETHHLYYLASSFTDYWRRINIYWKDFMMKVFYYPIFFRLRRLGSTTALVIATLLVFVATMLLHSYQWFWIRGTYPLTAQDALFWSILAVLVVVNAVWESKKGRKRSLGGAGWSLGDLPARVARTVGTFVVICVLWALWTSSSVSEWAALLSAWDNGGLALDKSLMPTLLVFAATVGTTTAIRPRKPKKAEKPAQRKRFSILRKSALTTTLLMLAVYAVGNPRVYTQFDDTTANVIQSLREKRLNRRDQALLERGYYENLLAIDRFNIELSNLYWKRPAEWRSIWQTDAVRWTDDVLRMELVPFVEMEYKGASLSTNRWGMRDRDYEKVKPTDAYRIALLGASPVMGSGVADEESFEWLIEERLNNENQGSYSRYEILNFSVPSYTPLQQAMVLNTKALSFDPDAAIYVAHETDAQKSVGLLAQLIEAGTEIPYPHLREISVRADVDEGTDRSVTIGRLAPFGDEIIDWSYRQIAESSRQNDVLPVWVFMPMPAVGFQGPAATADRSDPRVVKLFRAAEDAGFTIIDLSGVYDGHDLESLWVAEWDRHPNATGHRLIADKLYEALMSGENALSEALFRRVSEDKPGTP